MSRLTERDIRHLEGIAPIVLIGDAISEDYAHDELSTQHHYPDALVKVDDAAQVPPILSYAHANRIPVVVRGAGTGLVGGAVALQGGIMLDMTGLDRILELDRENMTVAVQPGVLLMDLQRYAEQNGLFYPPDPGEKAATIGGNISTNAGGMRAVKYGVTRDYVMGLTVVLATGEVLELGGKVVKNSSGYSLLDLVIGSEGTLCVITQALLRLLPLPAHSVSLLAPFDSMEDALQLVPKLILSGLNPVAMEFMDRAIILMAEEYLGKRFPDSRSPFYLLLTFDGHAAEVEAQYTAAAELCIHNGAIDAYIVDTEERKTSVWNARGAFLEAIKASTPDIDECDVVVPRSKVAEFIAFSQRLAERLHVRIPSFGHAGDGNLHLYVCRDGLGQSDWEKLLPAAFDELYRKAVELRGQVSGEHGVGYAKRSFLKSHLGDTQINLMRGIKQAFDPHGILNPGKIV